MDNPTVIKKDLLSLSKDELTELIISIGEPKYRASQIFGQLHKGLTPAEMSNVGKKTTEKLKEVAQWAWTPEAMEKRLETHEEIPFCHEHICLEYRRPEWIQVIPADMTLEGEGTMDIGGVTIRCETCDSPHSRDALLISADGCLIIGDAGYEDFYELDRQYDKGRLSAFIDKLKGRTETFLVAGHEPPLRREEFIEYLENILKEL